MTASTGSLAVTSPRTETGRLLLNVPFAVTTGRGLQGCTERMKLEMGTAQASGILYGSHVRSDRLQPACPTCVHVTVPSVTVEPYPPEGVGCDAPVVPAVVTF